MTTVTKMRLSKETYNILKNFAAINSNILINPGNVLKTMSAGKNIYVEAKVTEDFDVAVPIWDLNKFLGVVSMFANPDLEFHDTYVVISKWSFQRQILLFRAQSFDCTGPRSKDAQDGHHL